jgi:hypothetical protein
MLLTSMVAGTATASVMPTARGVRAFRMVSPSWAVQDRASGAEALLATLLRYLTQHASAAIAMPRRRRI